LETGLILDETPLPGLDGSCCCGKPGFSSSAIPLHTVQISHSPKNNRIADKYKLQSTSLLPTNYRGRKQWLTT